MNLILQVFSSILAKLDGNTLKKIIDKGLDIIEDKIAEDGVTKPEQVVLAGIGFLRQQLGITEEALEEFKQISRTTAVPTIAKEAEKVLDELRHRKADSELKVAEFYEKQKKYKSALMYYNEIAKKFPGTPTGKYAKEKAKYLELMVKE